MPAKKWISSQILQLNTEIDQTKNLINQNQELYADQAKDLQYYQRDFANYQKVLSAAPDVDANFVVYETARTVRSPKSRSTLPYLSACRPNLPVRMAHARIYGCSRLMLLYPLSFHPELEGPGANRSRKVLIPHDQAAYRDRNRIERCFNTLKHFRRFARGATGQPPTTSPSSI